MGERTEEGNKGSKTSFDWRSEDDDEGNGGR